MNNKIEQAINLLKEAKTLISEIEVELKTSKQEYNIPVSDLNFNSKTLKGRFLSACEVKNILTIGDLIDYSSIRFAKIRNVGLSTIDEVKEVLYNQYGVIW